MSITKKVKFLILCLLALIGVFQSTMADNSMQTVEAKRILTLAHNYQIETIDSLLQSVYVKNLTQGKLNPLQINYLLFQTGRGTLALENLDALYSSLKNHSQPSKSLRFLELYSVLLEEAGQPETALLLWKEIATKITDQPNDNTTTRIFTEIMRIYNDQSQFEKASLFEIPLQNLEVEQLDYNVFLTAELEKIKILLSRNDETEAYSKLESLWALADVNSSNYFYQLLEINVIAWIISPDSLEQLSFVSALKNFDTKHLEPHKRSLLSSFLGLYYSTSNADSSLYYYQNAYKTYEQFENDLITFSNQLTEIKDVISNENTVGQPPKQLKLASIFIFGALAAVLLFLFIWMLRKYLEYKTVILEKVQLIEKNTTESQAQMQESFNNFETLSKERAADLQKELTDRERIDSELQEALASAEDANYQKNAFLSNISHEIRTPLNGIIGFSNLLENELALLDEPLLFDYANSIQKSGEKLLHLLNNIIDISRLEANDINFQVVSCFLPLLIEEILQPLYPQANKKGIRIITEVAPLNVRADKEMLARVMDEILDNAMKYTEKGFIRVIVEKIEGEESVKIAIRDTGVGIDKNYLPELFEAFLSNNHGYSRQYQGAALGIPLSKQLVEKMGGIFKLESEKAAGTTITIILPQASQSIPEVDTHHKDVGQTDSIQEVLAGKRILLVEDDRASQKIIAKYLDSYAEVVVAIDGSDALYKLNQQQNSGSSFDLFLFDINLPAPWDGIKLLQHIKTTFLHYAQTPAIAETAYAMSGDKEELMIAGFDGYLPKPVQRLELYKEIIRVTTRNNLKH